MVAAPAPIVVIAPPPPPPPPPPVSQELVTIAAITLQDATISSGPQTADLISADARDLVVAPADLALTDLDDAVTPVLAVADDATNVTSPAQGPNQAAGTADQRTPAGTPQTGMNAVERFLASLPTAPAILTSRARSIVSASVATISARGPPALLSAGSQTAISSQSPASISAVPALGQTPLRLTPAVGALTRSAAAAPASPAEVFTGDTPTATTTTTSTTSTPAPAGTVGDVTTPVAPTISAPISDVVEPNAPDPATLSAPALGAVSAGTSDPSAALAPSSDPADRVGAPGTIGTEGDETISDRTGETNEARGPPETYQLGTLLISLKAKPAAAAAPLPIDWNTVTSAGLSLVMSLLNDTGTSADLSFSGAVSGSGTLAYTKSTVSLPGGGSGDLLVGTLSNFQLDAGSSSFGVHISGTAVKIALLLPQDSGDARRWIGIEATGLTIAGTLPGLDGAITNGGVQINTATAGTTAIDWTTIAASTLTMTAEALGVSGRIASLSIGGVLSGSTDFAFAKPSTDLITGTLSNLVLNAGSGSFGASITGSSVKVALLSQGANRFLGIEASGLGITATLPGFTGAITNGGVRVNRGIGAAAIDWTTIAGSGITLQTAVTGVSGRITTLAVGGLTGSTDFTLAKQTVAAGDLLTGTLSNLVLAAGSSTFGATITGTDVKFAVLSSGADRFTGIEASGLGITATLPGFTGTFSNGGVRVNTASGSATPIDWTTIAESGLTLPSAVTGVSGHIDNLSIAGALTGSTDFTITKTTVAQGDLLTGKLTGLVLAAGSSTFGASITGASVNVAFLSTPTARYTGIEASGLGITASLPGMTGTFSNGGVKVNSASAGAAVDWTTVTGSGLTLTTSIVSVSGDIATLSIAGALTGSATVALSRTLVTLPGGGEGELLTGTLSNLQLTAGSSTFGVTVQGDGVKIALLAPTAPGDNRRWTGIEATGLSIITPNLPGFSGTFTNGGVLVNTASAGATPLDWTTLPASGLSLTAGITSVSGHIGALTIAGVLTGTTDFTITKSTVAQGELLTGLLTNLSLAAGDPTFGVTVTGSNIAFALLKNASAQTFTGIEASGLGISATLPGFAATFQNGGVKVNTSAFDWTAVAGSGLTLTGQIVGVSGEMRNLTVAGVLTGQADFAIQKTTVGQGTLLSGSLSNVSLAAGDASFGVTVSGGNVAFAVLKNASAQTFTGIEASGLGISATLPGFAATFQNGGVKVNTSAFDWTAVAGSGLTLTGQIIGVSGEMRNLTVAGVLTGQADFAIQKTTVAQGDLLSGTLSGVQLSAGDPSFGVTVTGASVKFAVLKNASAQTFTGIEASGLGISAMLPGFSATFQNGGVKVNSASAGATPIDWTTVTGSGLTLTAGIIGVSGEMRNLTVAGVLTGQANFAIQKTTVAQGDLLSGTLSGVQLSAGDASFGVTVTGASVKFAVLKNASAQTFTGIEASGLGISATLPGFAATFQNGGVKVNSASAGATPIDWTTVTGSGITLTAAIIGVSGEMRNLTVAGVLTGQADFAIQKTTVAQGDLLSGTLSGVQLSAGDPSFGVTVTGTSVKFAVLEERERADVHRHRGQWAWYLGHAAWV